MVIFDHRDAADGTLQAIEGVRAKTGHKTEFKFSQSRRELRDAFFAGVVHCPFKVRALIVDKEKVHSNDLRANASSFYSYFAKTLMAYDGEVLANADVRIDGSGNREFRRSLNGYLRQQLGQKVRDVRMSDSKRDPLMQLADMCIGAITRSQRERDEANRWLDQLKPRIADIKHFG